jgi:hypothetical protein
MATASTSARDESSAVIRESKKRYQGIEGRLSRGNGKFALPQRPLG